MLVGLVLGSWGRLQVDWGLLGDSLLLQQIVEEVDWVRPLLLVPVEHHGDIVGQGGVIDLRDLINSFLDGVGLQTHHVELVGGLEDGRLEDHHAEAPNVILVESHFAQVVRVTVALGAKVLELSLQELLHGKGAAVDEVGVEDFERGAIGVKVDLLRADVYR